MEDFIKGLPVYIDNVEKYDYIVGKLNSLDKFIEFILKLVNDIKDLSSLMKIVSMLEKDITKLHSDIDMSNWITIFANRVKTIASVADILDQILNI